MMNKVLLVDDDPNILAAFRRQARKGYGRDTAESGAQGLELMAQSGPYAVIVSDMRMPEMDGIAFLAEVRRRSPETVRIMLTGNADLQTCIDSVNQGYIFRFLTKPCDPETMNQALEAGIQQYRLVCAEKELTHGTVAGCIRTLTDILSIVSPGSFGQATRIRQYVRHMAAQISSQHIWEYEMAATLCQIGCVALPREILGRIAAGRPLTPEQHNLLANHPTIGCQLLAEIPRLKLVALIVEKQKKPPKEVILPYENMSEEEIVNLGAQLLRVALDLDVLLNRGEPFIKALATLHAQYGNDHPLVDALMSFERDSADKVVVQVKAAELTANMAAATDIMDFHGKKLVAKGQRLTPPMIFYLQSCLHAREVAEPFLVEILSEFQ
ncbi:MAG TPA: response regulator [Candidatus Hydrogenedentes bacterium]|nr:response regulator [Candidatus Hydrogenedentota bacterium]